MLGRLWKCAGERAAPHDRQHRAARQGPLHVQRQPAVEQHVAVGLHARVVVAAPDGDRDRAVAADAHIPADVQDVAGGDGDLGDARGLRGFLLRETGLQHAALDVDAAGHEAAAAERAALDVDRACVRAGDRKLAAFNRRAALVGVVARHDQRPGALLGQRSRVEVVVDLVLNVGRARIHPFLAPLDGVLIGDLVVQLGMAVGNSLDVRIIQNALKHEGLFVKRAVRVQHVGAEFTGVGNALLPCSPPATPDLAFPFP